MADREGVMIEEVRRFQKAVPFKPFEILMVDGRRFAVPHPDFIFIPPKGLWVYVTNEDAITEHINILVIGSIRHVSEDGKKRRKAG
jgi:hypothetical protein